jgi:HEPN domain-containing protein
LEKEGWVTMLRQSQAFWAQSRADYATAVVLLDAGVHYASVFFSQQAAEKALKAAAIEQDRGTPRGHHLIQIADAIHAPVDVMSAAAELNADFITTRNPDTVNGVPARMYDQESAQLHLRAAETIINWVKLTI